MHAYEYVAIGRCAGREGLTQCQREQRRTGYLPADSPERPDSVLKHLAEHGATQEWRTADVLEGLCVLGNKHSARGLHADKERSSPEPKLKLTTALTLLSYFGLNVLL